MTSSPDHHLITIHVKEIPLHLVKIPPGSFLMGSPEVELGTRENERPVHEVHVPSFHCAVLPVTQAQWLSLMGKLPAISPDFSHDDMPVVNVWLEDAYDFCDALRRHCGIPFRLPSEAEWEYACRAGTDTPFYWGETIGRELVNFNDPSEYCQAPSGLKPAGFSGAPNAFGLFDMHGNVWEWCSDTWHDSYDGAPVDGSSWTAGGDAGYHVQRGGSWTDPAVVCRSAFRVGDIAHNSDDIVGLRVCATIP